VSARYDHIQQELWAKGKRTYSDSRLKVINNFSRDFGIIFQRAGVEEGEFHDLRRTAVCNWFAEGMTEFEVMKLGGHADFKTTQRFFLRVRDDRDNSALKPKKVSSRNRLPKRDLRNGQGRN